DGKSVVTVKVGYWVAHPNTPDHFIQWIEIQANGLTITRYDMNPVAADPEITCVVNVDPGTTLTALESCNLHGIWVNQIVV
ncbi:MAG: superoxide reductase, partial [Coriobacteriales bacterium]|nr:superoxide reductase [Coriobacteriales bacterium]